MPSPSGRLLHLFLLLNKHALGPSHKTHAREKVGKIVASGLKWKFEKTVDKSANLNIF
jgi:hypothetical protein